MLWIIALAIVTQLRSLCNGFISDDVTVLSEVRNKGYPVRWKEHLLASPPMIIHDWLWKVFKDKVLPQHIINLFIYIALCCSFYIVGQKYLPENIMFLATLFFVVHPCNCQVASWISGRYYMVGLIIALWALYFNNLLLYLMVGWFHPMTIGLPLIMKMPIIFKVLAIALALYMYIGKALKGKTEQTKSEGTYKIDNLRLCPRKLIVALKSFCYYFTLAFFPTRMGWFHTMGEPIDKKLKSFDRHFWLSLTLVLVMLLFYRHPAFVGLLLFGLFIAPFTNLITFALFTSERYMAGALLGWSIFLAYVTINNPIVATVIITAYFMRTQLELWAYQSDFMLALYSLLNFRKSGFAWSNIVSIFLHTRKPYAAYEMAIAGIKECPEFPTLYYQLHIMYKSSDLFPNPDLALLNLEKACKYGQHQRWFDELEHFRNEVKNIRINRFKEKLNARGFNPPAGNTTRGK